MRINTSSFAANAPKFGMMTRSLLLHILLLQTSLVFASPFHFQKIHSRDNLGSQVVGLFSNLTSLIPTISPAWTSLLNTLLTGPNTPYSIPQNSNDVVVRPLNMGLVRTNFLYGPAVGGGPAYPSGLLGIAKAAQDLVDFVSEFTPEAALTALDDAQFVLDSGNFNNFQSLDDYSNLYKTQFKNTVPAGVDPGMTTNYTQDLLFSMQRLSSSPFQVRRLNPKSDTLAFTVPDSTITQITGFTLQQLFQQGSLFYADYRDQANLTATIRYAAACDAYFYINATSGNFLPLAIRPNAGSNLIYTPLDTANDWLLAKVMYSVNDFWAAQWTHLAATHEVLQVVWAAAIRGLSAQHPVYALLNRLTFQVYSIQVVAEAVLFLPGAAVDEQFPFTGSSAKAYTDNQYFNAGSGRFQGNYFTTNLKNRGLIGSTYGPPLKNFPFYEDGSVIVNATRTFFTAFVNSYYSSDAVVAADSEIQAWASECNGGAQVIDFPAKINTISTLVDVLTHIAYLGSVNHHTINTNELLKVSGALPLCPVSLFKPPPTVKGGNFNVADWLPKADQILQTFTLGALFSRPLLVNSNRTVIHMFDDASILGRMNPKTQAANTAFINSMKQFSSQVSTRTFGSDGLSQGMPFLWRALDPNVAPFSVST